MSADIQAIRVLARSVWDQLPLAQRAALRRAQGHGSRRFLDISTNKRTVKSMQAKRLVVEGDRELEPLGLLLRAEGLAADEAAAKRRFSRRKVSP